MQAVVGRAKTHSYRPSEEYSFKNATISNLILSSVHNKNPRVASATWGNWRQANAVHLLRILLSAGPEPDVLDRDAVEGELEVVDGAHEGGVEAVGKHLGGERVRSLDDKDAAGYDRKPGDRHR